MMSIWRLLQALIENPDIPKVGVNILGKLSLSNISYVAFLSGKPFTAAELGG
jgi:hypothetical protein